MPLTNSGMHAVDGHEEFQGPSGWTVSILVRYRVSFSTAAIIWHFHWMLSVHLNSHVWHRGYSSYLTETLLQQTDTLVSQWWRPGQRNAHSLAAVPARLRIIGTERWKHVAVFIVCSMIVFTTGPDLCVSSTPNNVLCIVVTNNRSGDRD
jgi:hypothetical protein